MASSKCKFTHASWTPTQTESERTTTTAAAGKRKKRGPFIIYATHRNIAGHFVYRDEYLVNSPHEVLNDKFFI